jgi:hypothetical protein
MTAEIVGREQERAKVLNTVSPITEPVTRKGNVGPSVVTTGMSEFFKNMLEHDEALR